MRFNKTELNSLASQPSHLFDKEGVLILRERHDTFFRRQEISIERWCRLRGNLLFYFKSKDRCSEPAGVIVLESCQVTLDDKIDVPYSFNLLFDGGSQSCSAVSEEDRDSWITAIHQASFSYIRTQVETLEQQLELKRANYSIDIHQHRMANTTSLDVNKPPFLEMSLSCDNLRCDGDGQPPSPRIVIHIMNPPNNDWILYAQSDVIDRTSNPNFLSTVSFRSSDGIDAFTKVQISVLDVKERISNTVTQIGQALVTLGSIKEAGRTRLALLSPTSRTVGFVTIIAWTLEAETVDQNSQTNKANATPRHQPVTTPAAAPCHRRTQSLPPRLGCKTCHPTQGHLSLLYDNALMATYRFHSGLGGDIAVLEVMAESKFCFIFPQQLLQLWISEERRNQEELSSLGDLADKWHTQQMTLLNQHVNLINMYGVALETLDTFAHSGSSFRKSSDKLETCLEFAPINLHLQRLWAQNESLRKSGFYDTITCGAFAANSIGFKQGGLVNMLQETKSSKRIPDGWDKARVSETAVEGVRRIRLEVLAILRVVLYALKNNNLSTILETLPKLQEKTRLLLNILETSLVEEAFDFLDQIRIPQNPSRIMTIASRSYSSYNIMGYMSPEEALDLELMTPRSDPDRPGGENTDINLYNGNPDTTPDMDIDQNCYRPTDEPEPWDLIQLNVQASLMCLTSKINSFCDKIKDSDALGGSDSPEKQTNALGNYNRTTLRFKTLDETDNPCKSQVSNYPGNKTTLGSARSSCSATPDVSPCEEDSGIGLEKIPSEIEKTDCISEGGLSNDDDRRDDLPFDRNDVEKEEICIKIDNSECAKHSTDDDKSTTTIDTNGQSEDDNVSIKKKESLNTLEPVHKPYKLESIMERSVEDLDINYSAEELNVQDQEDDSLLADNHILDQIQNCHSSPKIHLDLSDKSKSTEDIISPNSDQQFTGQTDSALQHKSSTPEQIDWLVEVRPGVRKLRQAMDGLMRTARLVHSVFRLQQKPEDAQKAFNIKYRRDVCFSQALTSVVTSLMTRLWCRKADPVFLTVLSYLGPLAVFEVLLSWRGDNLGMLSDMLVAVEDLSAVEFVMVPVSSVNQSGRTMSEGTNQNSSPHHIPNPTVSGNRNGMKVILPVPDQILNLLPEKSSKCPNDSPSFHITPVLFNIGINEQATAAAKLGSDTGQYQNNEDSFERLSQYYHRYKKLPLPQDNSRRSTFNNSTSPLNDLMESLGHEVQCKTSKNVKVIQKASQCCRLMSGLRFTSCKSGKDRTGMSVTLEQVNILASEYDLAETEYKRALDCMRSDGTRLMNCEKNIGTRRYAFNVLQLATFPTYYSPPPGTYGSKKT